VHGESPSNHPVGIGFESQQGTTVDHVAVAVEPEDEEPTDPSLIAGDAFLASSNSSIESSFDDDIPGCPS
jgi:hypothetical protein